MDLNSAGYGLLAGFIGFLSIAYFLQKRRAERFESETNKSETLLKVQTKREENDAQPIDEAIRDFDNVLDGNIKRKPGSD